MEQDVFARLVYLGPGLLYEVLDTFTTIGREHRLFGYLVQQLTRLNNIATSIRVYAKHYLSPFLYPFLYRNTVK